MLTIRKRDEHHFTLYAGEVPAVSFGPLVADVIRPHLTEPVTETIPWHEAKDRMLPDGRKVVYVTNGGFGPCVAPAKGDLIYGETVEVLAQ